MMVCLLEYLLVSLLFTTWDCSAQITSSQDNFTFCPGDSVILTCSLSGAGHVWQISGSTTAFTLYPEHVPTNSNADNNIMFAINGVEGGTITSSTMTFTASVSVISNGTWVSCSNATTEPRVTFNQTVVIFGTVSPPHMPSLTRTSGDYSSLTLSFQQPLYGHKCVTGYRISGPNMEQNTTQTMLISGLNLCKMVYNLSLFAQTTNGSGNAVTVTSSVPDFSDLGRVSNLSISADKSLLQWNPPPNAPDGCISGYNIQWPGNSVTTTGSVNSVEVSFLIRKSNSGLPFCVDVNTTVTPSVPLVPSPLVSSQNDPPVLLVYPDPDFPSPSIILLGSGSELDTVVSWQNLSSSGFSENICITAGIQQGQQCQATLTDGISKVFPHECSAVGTVVEFYVTFQYMQCEKMSVSSRQLPSFNISAVTISETTDAIKLEIELRDISGERCDVSRLCIVSALFWNNVRTASNSRTYSSGRNEFIFLGLTVGTSYSYQINVTESNNVIASYSGQAQTTFRLSIFVLWPVVVIIIILCIVVVIVICIVVVYLFIKKNTNIKGSGKNGDTHKFNEKMFDIDHVHSPTGEEYAVVEKKKPGSSKPTSSDNQDLYQDPKTIEHEQAPETGDLYAVTEKKKGMKKQPTEEELAMMYSVPNKSSKSPEGITYADIDVAPQGWRQQPPQTEYAAVVN